MKLKAKRLKYRTLSNSRANIKTFSDPPWQPLLKHILITDIFKKNVSTYILLTDI